MVDFEKGSAAWDIGMILTRHKARSHGDSMTCRRVEALESTVRVGISAEDRFSHADREPCSCGMGISEIERTSLKGQPWKMQPQEQLQGDAG